MPSNINIAQDVSFNGLPQLTDQQREREERAKMREMTMLALSKAFSLSHGVEEVDDPSGFEVASEGLASALEEQAEKFSALATRWEEQKQAREREALTKESAPKGVLDQELKEFLTRESYEQSKLTEPEARDLIKEAKKTLEEWAMKVALSSGALRVLSVASSDGAALRDGAAIDGSSKVADVEALAQLCGLQKSQQDLSISGGDLENRYQGYSLRVKRAEGGAFEGFEALDWDGKKRLGMGLSKPADPDQRKLASVLTPQGSGIKHVILRVPTSLQKGALKILFTALSPRGAPIDMEGPVSSKVKISPWSYGNTAEEMSEQADKFARQAKAVREGAGVSVALGMAQEASSGEPLGELIEAIQTVAGRIESIATVDKARRTCEWFDGLAGERSFELAGKVWGESISWGVKLSEVELLARASAPLWEALEGQEALGLFSIRAADRLGLTLSGRDLPDRAKRRLKEEFSLSDGGWRLLGKMPALGKSEAAEWMIDRDVERGGASLSAMFSGRPPAILAPEKENALDLLCATVSACAARGLGPKETESAMSILRSNGLRSSWAFFGPVGAAPEGAPQEAWATEARAKGLRIPKILEDWVALAAKDAAKGSNALRDIKDWLLSAEWGVWSALPEKAGLSDVQKEHQRWAQMVADQVRSTKARVSWDGLSEGWSDPQTGFSAIPLTDGGMLWDEGKAMHHCVSSYAAQCESGSSRIFSIRKDGHRFGTAQVRMEGSFEVVQFRGKFNKQITDERAWAAANAAAKQCEEAVAANPERLPKKERLTIAADERIVFGGIPRPELNADEAAEANRAMDIDIVARLRAGRAAEVAPDPRAQHGVGGV